MELHMARAWERSLGAEQSQPTRSKTMRTSVTQPQGNPTTWGRLDRDVSLVQPPGEDGASRCLNSIPLRTSAENPAEAMTPDPLRDNTFVLFYATKFVMICYAAIEMKIYSAGKQPQLLYLHTQHLRLFTTQFHSPAFSPACNSQHYWENLPAFSNDAPFV